MTTLQQYQLKQSIPLLVDFSAKWCGPCKMMAPLLHTIGEQNKDRLELMVIDIDSDIHINNQIVSGRDLCNEHNVRGVPTLIIINDGKEVWRSVGTVTQERVIAAINQHIL